MSARSGASAAVLGIYLHLPRLSPVLLPDQDPSRLCHPQSPPQAAIQERDFIILSHQRSEQAIAAHAQVGGKAAFSERWLAAAALLGLVSLCMVGLRLVTSAAVGLEPLRSGFGLNLVQQTYVKG